LELYCLYKTGSITPTPFRGAWNGDIHDSLIEPGTICSFWFLKKGLASAFDSCLVEADVDPKSLVPSMMRMSIGGNCSDPRKTEWVIPEVVSLSPIQPTNVWVTKDYRESLEFEYYYDLMGIADGCLCELQGDRIMKDIMVFISWVDDLPIMETIFPAGEDGVVPFIGSEYKPVMDYIIEHYR